MSEKPPSFVELQQIYDHWWNTTSGLELEYPGIEKSRGWSLFKAEYDNLEKQETRLREVGRTCWWVLSSESIFLRDLAMIASGKAPPNVCEELRDLDIAGAGKLLGEHVSELFSVDGWERLSEAVEVLKIEMKRKSLHCMDYTSVIAELITAFKSFLERERKLPTKKELYVEANRIKNGLHESDPRWNDTCWESSEISPYMQKAGFRTLSKGKPARSWGG